MPEAISKDWLLTPGVTPIHILGWFLVSCLSMLGAAPMVANGLYTLGTLAPVYNTKTAISFLWLTLLSSIQ